MNNDASDSKSEDAPWSPWDEWTYLGEVKSETGTLSAWIREAADGESIEVRAVKSEPSADYIRSDFENDGYSWMPSDLQDGFIQLKIWTKEIAEELESHAEVKDSYIWRNVMFEACSWKFDLGWEDLGHTEGGGVGTSWSGSRYARQVKGQDLYEVRYSPYDGWDGNCYLTRAELHGL